VKIGKGEKQSVPFFCVCFVVASCHLSPDWEAREREAGGAVLTRCAAAAAATTTTTTGASGAVHMFARTRGGGEAR